MRKSIRTQVDDLGDFYSDATGVRIDGPDLARQEFAHDADINNILQKFGLNAPQREPIFGEVDYDTDLHTALHAIDQAIEAHASLPIEVKKRYPTWQQLLEAAETGELQLGPEPDNTAPETPPLEEPPEPA